MDATPGQAQGRAPLYFLECMQREAIALWDDRDPWTWAGRRRQRHKDLGELHDRDRPRPERLEAIVSVVQCLLRFVQARDNLRVLHPRKKEGSRSPAMTMRAYPA